MDFGAMLPGLESQLCHCVILGILLNLSGPQFLHL